MSIERELQRFQFIKGNIEKKKQTNSKEHIQFNSSHYKIHQ